MIDRQGLSMLSLAIGIDARLITSFDALHDVFADRFGFPDSYSQNMDAWIDCMTSLDSPEDGMTAVHVPKGGVVVIQLDHAGEFVDKHPDLYRAIVDGVAFVNYRRIEVGQEPVLALSYTL